MMHRALSSVLLLLTTSACVDLGVLARESPEQRRFTPEVVRSGEPAAPIPDIALELRPVHADASFTTRSFLYRQQGGEVQSDYYNEWLVPPAQLIGETMRDWLRQSGRFASVRGSGSFSTPTHLLEVDLSDLCGDYSQSPAQARVRFTAHLLTAEEGQPLASIEHRGDAPIEGEGPEAMVAAMGKALTMSLVHLEESLAAQLR